MTMASAAEICADSPALLAHREGVTVFVCSDHDLHAHACLCIVRGERSTHTGLDGVITAVAIHPTCDRIAVAKMMSDSRDSIVELDTAGKVLRELFAGRLGDFGDERVCYPSSVKYLMHYLFVSDCGHHRVKVFNMKTASFHCGFSAEAEPTTYTQWYPKDVVISGSDIFVLAEDNTNSSISSLWHFRISNFTGVALLENIRLGFDCLGLAMSIDQSTVFTWVKGENRIVCVNLADGSVTAEEGDRGVRVRLVGDNLYVRHCGNNVKVLT